MVVQKRKNMMEEIREELAQDHDLNAIYQRELAQVESSKSDCSAP